MSRFSGSQGKNTMQQARVDRRATAEIRNNASRSHTMPCGHVHGENSTAKCVQLRLIIHGFAGFRQSDFKLKA